MFRNRPFGLVSGVFVSCLLASLKESTLGLQLLSLSASSLFVCLSSRRVWRVPVLSISAFSRPYRDWQFSCWVFPSSQTQFSKGSISLVYHDVVFLLKQSWFWIWMYLRNLCVNVFRNQIEKRSFAKLKEDDILHLAKLILPALNFAISKTRELFSGEPSMTLRVIS